MQKLIAVQGDYKIIKARNKDYIVINLKGEYENHSHYKKLSTCKLAIQLIDKQLIPTSAYILESLIRLTIDGPYKQRLINAYNAQIRKKQKPYYININKGVKRRK